MTDASASLNAINCTTCGASLPALAGHKAKALICRYCGSVMDRHDGYKVLEQYRDMRRPDGPFSIGMSGEILGVEQTVVGIVGVEAYIEGARYHWTDYQLFSPTHGYGWLTCNNGHLVHSRTVRGDIEPLTGMVQKTAFSALGRDYKFFESYRAKVNYIEGELTWLPSLGYEFDVAEGIAPPYGFATGRTSAEVEYEAQTYLDWDETVAAFGAESSTRLGSGIHPLQPFKAPLHRFAALLAAAFAVAVAVFGFVLANDSEGKVIAEGILSDPKAGLTINFDAPAPSTLMAIDMITDKAAKKRLERYNFVLTHTGTGVERKFSEGSYSSEATYQSRLRSSSAGPHTLTVIGVPFYIGDPMPTPVTIKIRSGLYVPDFLYLLAGIFLLIALSFLGRQLYFNHKRWQA